MSTSQQRANLKQGTVSYKVACGVREAMQRSDRLKERAQRFADKISQENENTKIYERPKPNETRR